MLFRRRTGNNAVRITAAIALVGIATLLVFVAFIVLGVAHGWRDRRTLWTIPFILLGGLICAALAIVALGLMGSTAP